MTTRKPTAFEEQIHKAVRKVPPGKVTTYKLLASYVGCGSCRAVGQALKRNPFAPDVPCHRVIASDLTLGGYAGSTHGKMIRVKRKMLADEGVLFRGSPLSLADPSVVYPLT